MTYVQVARALALSESRVLRAYCRAGKVLVPASGVLLEQALEIVSDVQVLGGFERSLLPRREAAPATKSVA